MSRTTQVPPRPPDGCRLRGSHPLRRAFPDPSANRHGVSFIGGPTTPDAASTAPVWASARSLATTCAITFVFFSSGYLDVSVPRVGLLPGRMMESPPSGCPIRISADHWACAPPRGFSQLVASFVASESQGILHAPFSPFFFSSKKGLLLFFRPS